MNYVYYLSLFVIVTYLRSWFRQKVRGSKFKFFLRYVLVFAPYLSIFFICELNMSYLDFSLDYVFVSSLIMLIALMMVNKNTRIVFNKSFMQLAPDCSWRDALSTILSLLCSCLFEELFFRYKVITDQTTISLIYCNLLFVLSHYLDFHIKNKMDIKEYIRLFILGILLSMTGVYYESIVPCILLHLLYDLPYLYLRLAKFNKKLASVWD